MGTQGFVRVNGGRVWYEIFGQLGEGKIPLITLHGGPGGSSQSMRAFEELASERPVIIYDQLGCGQSDRPENPELWRIERFVQELGTLRSELNLDKVHLLGHSWGTMLLADYLLTHPEDVVSATFSSPCLSAKMWAEDANKLRLQLPEDVQKVLTECEATGKTDSPEYREAEKVYMRHFVCRVEVPEEERKAREASFGKDVYEYMWGPSEFHPTGTLKNYDRTGQLHTISTPSLFTCGRYDEATPTSTAVYHRLTPGSKFHVFENAAHSPLREEKEEYLRVIKRFLRYAEQV